MTIKVSESITIDELPEILTANHVSSHLHVSKRRAYELFHLSPAAGGIKSFSFGKSVRTTKADYLNWLSVRNFKA